MLIALKILKIEEQKNKKEEKKRKIAKKANKKVCQLAIKVF